LQAEGRATKHHIAGSVRGAIPYYQHAIELDPDFGLAYQAIAAAYNSRAEHQLEMGALKKAYELRNRMTEPTRLRAECRYYESVPEKLRRHISPRCKRCRLFPGMPLPTPTSLLTSANWDNRTGPLTKLARRLACFQVRTATMTWYFRSIHADRLNEAKAAFDAADARNFDSADLRVDRALLAFLQHDKAAMEEQWSWAVGKPDADRFLSQRAVVECYYGHFRNSRLLWQQAIDMATKAGTIPWYSIYWGVEEAEVGNSERARSVGSTSSQESSEAP